MNRIPLGLSLGCGLDEILKQYASIIADTVAEKVVQQLTERDADMCQKTYTRKEVCSLLNVTTQTLGEYIKKGKLVPMPCVKGRGQLFDAKAVDAAVGLGRLRKGKREILDMIL